jgi:hypothetical protein
MGEWYLVGALNPRTAPHKTVTLMDVARHSGFSTSTSVAEWRSRALGWKRASRSFGPRDRYQSTAPETVDENTSTITTKTGHISDSGKIRPAAELQSLRVDARTKSCRCRDSVGCITATPQRPESTSAQNRRLPCDAEEKPRLDPKSSRESSQKGLQSRAQTWVEAVPTAMRTKRASVKRARF